MKILIACEESQRVAIAFRKRGFEAYSCDVKQCSGGHPEYHILGDAIQEAYSGKYTMMVAHPPCTYLSRAGARWMFPKAGQICKDRFDQAMLARKFFMKLLKAPIKHIALENPTPLKVCKLPKHSQVIQPYQFGHPYSKRTLLWLKNLPALQATKLIEDFQPFLPSNTGGKKRGQKTSVGIAKNSTEASKTFQGIAEAMSNQWGDFLLNV